MVAVLAGREVDPSVVVMGQLEALGHITALPPIESCHFQGMVTVGKAVHESRGQVASSVHSCPNNGHHCLLCGCWCWHAAVRRACARSSCP